MTRRPAALALLLLAGGCGYPEFEFAPTDAGNATDGTAETGASADADDADSTLEESGLGDSELDTPAGDAPCGSGLSLCGAACVDTRTSSAHCGMCGKACAATEFCAAGTCRPEASCAALKKRYPTLATGAYMIDPDGPGPLTPFRVFCEMSDGDGWTLALKLDGAETTFGFAAALWTNDVLLNPTSTDLSENEAKFRSFTELPVKQLRLGMVDTTTRWITVDAAGSSLKSLFSGPKVTTSAGRAAWLSLVASPSLQTSCNEEGFNLDYTAAMLGPRIRMRLGIVGNNETDCSSPDTLLGFGVAIENPFCFGGVDPALVAGNLAGDPMLCGGFGVRTTRTFGYIFVR